MAALYDLLARSHALGADKRVTNYGGGNTSCKTTLDDPLTGDPIDVMHVKGSGGDLGTLHAGGLATLRLRELRGLKARYRGVEHEDEMVGLIELCCLSAGTAPSIDTAMHGLLDAPHVDHLHPDAVIALAAAADGEALTKECFGDTVAWLPWRRPGFELALEIEALQCAQPNLRGVVLGGHGLTTWAATSEECRRTSLEVIAQAEAFIAARGKAEPFGPIVQRPPAPAATDLAPIIRGLASRDRWMVGHFDNSDVVLDFLSREAAPRLVALGTSCPDHFIRTKVRPLLIGDTSRIAEAFESYRSEYAAYYARHATADSPPMRGADPTVVLVPGVGMFSFGATPDEARITGEFYVNAINVMRGAEALSTYAPVPEDEKFRVEYWALEEAKIQRRPKTKALSGRVALVTGAASGIGKAIAERLADEGATVVVTDLSADAPVRMDVSDAASVAAGFDAAVLEHGGVDIVVNNAGLSVSKPLADTTERDWDVQHDVMARGSFLVSRAAARVMEAQGVGGDIVYVVSKNAVFAGPNNVAYSSAKASQAHQVRLLAAELGEYRIRVNGVNPDGVVQGSGIFAGGWGAERAKVYGVAEEDLGQFYASRTLLKREVLPAHVAGAVFALIGGDLPLTTGTLVPVDGGVPQAFLR
ncbi:MAG TPA: bifunctional rhamnulose-1-phosphate aldolase/short-chain dehydrogenase [Acidimicrobiales bacterium]|nr:bifunctional rhamnulose-1-phosphate aldolase/short-chain dehydrogenase [Acidimicrobiales bacterium]